MSDDNKKKVMGEMDYQFLLGKVLKGIDDRFVDFTKQQNRIEDAVSEINKTIAEMKEQAAKQYDNCQNTVDVRELKERVPTKNEAEKADEDYETVKKKVEKHDTIFGNWKLYLIAGAVFLAGAMIIVNERYLKLKTIIAPNTEYRQKQDSIQEVKDVKEIKSILKN